MMWIENLYTFFLLLFIILFIYLCVALFQQELNLFIIIYVVFLSVTRSEFLHSVCNMQYV